MTISVGGCAKSPDVLGDALCQAPATLWSAPIATVIACLLLYPRHDSFRTCSVRMARGWPIIAILNVCLRAAPARYVYVSGRVLAGQLAAMAQSSFSSPVPLHFSSCNA